MGDAIGYKKRAEKNVRRLPFGKDFWLILSTTNKKLTPVLTAIKNIFTSPEKLRMALGVAKTIYTSRDKYGWFGWHMFTLATPPWIGEDKTSRDFNKVHNNFIKSVNSGVFKLSQLPRKGKRLEHFLNGPKWRNYIIFWSAKYAINATNSKQKNFVECGVCDGMSAYYATNSSITDKVDHPKYYL